MGQDSSPKGTAEFISWDGQRILGPRKEAHSDIKVKGMLERERKWQEEGERWRPPTVITRNLEGLTK